MPTISLNAPLPGIEHIVVVMLENRSFDNMLGMLYPASGSFDGLTGNEQNQYKALFKEHTVLVTNTPAENSPYITPYPDPGESFDDMSTQISGGMAGFAQNYFDKHPIDGAPGDIMFYFEPGQLPITNFIAETFAMSDQWFASAPVQTFANRMFCHCGTPSTWSPLGTLEARVNDVDYFARLSSPPKAVLGSVKETSIFQLLDGTSDPDPANWKVYFHDTPFSAINEYVYLAFKDGSPCVTNYDGSDYDPPHGTSFYADVASGNLPAYAFIEPRYFGNYSKSGNPANSNHPGSDSYSGLGGKPIDVRNGEVLLFDIYMTLLEHPEVFNKTLLVVTYDEHGGVYDHRTPNTAPFASRAGSPFTQQLGPFNYDSFGVRVPTFFANPAIPSGTVFRPPQPASGSYYPFDHTTILSTLCAQFGLNGPLTPRDAAAPTLAGLITQDAVLRNDLEPAPETQNWVDAFREPTAPAAPQKSIEEHNRLLVKRLEAKEAAEDRHQEP
jgi:phospholipase C